MIVKIITDIDDDFINRLQDSELLDLQGNFFQSSKYFKFYKHLAGHKPFFIILLQNDEIVTSLLAVIHWECNSFKKYLSKRCIIEGGPILKNNDPKLLDKLLKELNTINDKYDTIYTEFRNFRDQSHIKKIFEANEYSFYEHLNIIVEIPSYEEARASLSKSKKRQINKSIKSGAEIIEATSLSEIKEFYTILKELYKEKVKKPLPSLAFFEEFFKQKELGRYLVVTYDNKVIGGIMSPIYGDTIYEWYICGEDGKYEDIYPSVLATWAPIEYAAKNGLKYFDFLGAGRPNEDYGVREFKSKFGGELVNYGRFKKINNNLMYKVAELGIKIISKI